MKLYWKMTRLMFCSSTQSCLLWKRRLSSLASVEKGWFQMKTEALHIEHSVANLGTLVGALERNRYLKYVLTTSGKPKAILLSYPMYKVIEQTLGQFLAADESRPRDEAAHDAFDQMAADHWPEVRGLSRRSFRVAAAHR
jgi:hypothetical protein